MAHDFDLRVYNRASHGTQAEGDEDGEFDLHFELGNSLDGQCLYVGKMAMDEYALNGPTSGRTVYIVYCSLTGMFHPSSGSCLHFSSMLAPKYSSKLVKRTTKRTGNIPIDVPVQVQAIG